MGIFVCEHLGPHAPNPHCAASEFAVLVPLSAEEKKRRRGESYRQIVSTEEPETGPNGDFVAGCLK